MALNLQQKKNIVSKINAIANLSISAIIADTKNICTNEITKLREMSRKKNVIIHIIKNTLLKISLKNTHLECLNNKLNGPTLIGFSLKNPGSAAKLFHNFHKKNKNFKIITAALNKRILSKSEITTLCNLPSYKEAIIRFMITIKTATIGKLFSILLSLKQKVEH